MRDLRDEVRSRLAGASIDGARKLEIVEEIGQDLDDRYRELCAKGLAPDEARAQVLAELDAEGVLAREVARAEGAARAAPVPGAPGRNLARDLAQDLRYGVRALWKSPAFTTVTVLSLALAIGSNTAIFQIIDAVHMRTLPVAAPGELVSVSIKDRKWASGGFYSWHADLTNPMWELIRDGQTEFQSVMAWGDGQFNLSPSGEVRRASGLYVSGAYFQTLGVAPLLGRLITPAEDRRGCGAPGAVVSHGFWQRELGGDPTAVGRKLSLNGHDVEILGVTPPSFHGAEVGRSFDVAVPVCMDALFRGERTLLDERHGYWLSVIGRLKPGSTVERASAQLDSISKGIFEATVPQKYPPQSVEKYKAYRLGATPAATGISAARDEWTKPLIFLLVTAGLVLLIACANLANLLLARASAREREIAVRLALGASRGRLIRQLMTESLLLAVLGAAAGLWLASGLSDLLLGFLETPGNPLQFDLSPDWRVLGFTAGLAALTCLLFGLAPALRASRADVGIVLKTTGGHGATVARFGLRRILVAVQVAMSLVLLVGALLFARSLQKLASVDPGFDQTGVVQVQLDLRKMNLPPDRRVPLATEIVERLRAVPGVASASSAAIVPISGSGWNQDVTDASKEEKGQEGANTFFNRVSAGYFATMGMTLVAGRDFGPGDVVGAPTVGVANETFARQLFPGENPLGKTVRVAASSGGPAWTIQIIGLVRDTKYYNLREEFRPLMFVAAAQEADPFTGVNVLLRRAGPLSDVVAGVKKAVAEVAPLATIEMDYLERMVHESMLGDRLMAMLSGFFGLLAGILATIGLYGVVAYGVARRTHEIGIRMALGANRRQITSMIVRETAGLLGMGLVAGTLLALAGGKAAASMLYGLPPYDPLTFLLAIVLLSTVTLVAGALPARRAARVDPMVALREE